MSVFPLVQEGFPPSGFISTVTAHCQAGDLARQQGVVGATGTWPASNQARFWPINLNSWFTVQSFWVYLGTTQSGTLDMGLYDENANLVASTGNIAAGTASTVQTQSITPVTSPPGNYFLSMVRSSTIGTFRVTPTTQALEMAGGRQASLGSTVLPSTVTFGGLSSSYMPIQGMTVQSVPGTGVSIPPITISSMGEYFGGSGVRQVGITSPAPASGDWPAANRALYIPFTLPWSYHVRRLTWVNGGTIAGTAGMAIYSANGTRLVGVDAVTRAGGSSMQHNSVDYLLPPGGYYLGLVMSGTTGFIFRSPTNQEANRAMGILEQDVGSTTMPNTMSATATTSAIYPLIGFSSKSF